MTEHDNGSITVQQDPRVVARAEFVAGLRGLADFLDAQPEVDFDPSYGAASVLWYCGDAEGLAAAARTLGRVTKRTDDSFLNLDRRFGPHKIQAYASHDTVCERVVVGTETVTREQPDPEALKHVPTVTVTEEKEIVEWRCPDSLLAEGQA